MPGCPGTGIVSFWVFESLSGVSASRCDGRGPGYLDKPGVAVK